MKPYKFCKIFPEEPRDRALVKDIRMWGGIERKTIRAISVSETQRTREREGGRER